MKRLVNYYEILEISESCGVKEIKATYRRLAKEYHPDRIPESLPRLKHDAAEKLILIIKAYKCLSNDDLRSRYDVHLNRLKEGESSEAASYRLGPTLEQIDENLDKIEKQFRSTDRISITPPRNLTACLKVFFSLGSK